MADWLAEMAYGKGAHRFLAKAICGPQLTTDKQRVFLFCAIGHPLPDDISTDHYELWEAEVIVIPQRKYRNFDGPTGMRLDQWLTHGRALDPEEWRETYFDKDSDNG